MEANPLLEILMQLRFTAGLSEEDQHKLAAIAQKRKFRAGETLFTEGSDHKDLYVICSGRVEICMTIPARGCLPVLTLEAGDLVGWSTILQQGEMTATVAAIDETEVIAINAEALRALCDADHDIGYQIMQRIARALSQRLVACRLQVLDMYGEHPGQTFQSEKGAVE
ncbi:DNA-binding transcriptional dual regulator Crp [Gimesia chilikensis]|uniref:DNA-binding transcriptional dual regulator Crp n=2 Tax=Gimesia chilikensis TaxID=2605989 RepID=A0A517PS76_9PLAN|nr:DNA-binding transcriptional dual regulator Crp [Gimesia chilikensis]